MTDHDARIAQFQDLAARYPAMPQPLWSLATAYEEAGRYEDAVQTFRRLVTLQDDYCVAFLQLGSCLLELERFDEAIDALERARALAIEQRHAAPRQQAELLLEEARDP